MGFRMRVSMKGLDEVRRKLLVDVARTHRAELAKGLEAEGRNLIENEAAKTVPVRSGVLRDSKYADPAQMKRGVVSCQVGYRDPKAAAVYKDKHRPPAQTQWLKKAARVVSKGFAQRLADRIRFLKG